MPGTRDVLADARSALRAQNERAAGVHRRLYEDDLPGVLLADEVGKGKTYVALAVAFALLAERPRARVVILTHSRDMAWEWAKRWREHMRAKCPGHADDFDGRWCPRMFKDFQDLRTAYEHRPPSVAIGSYETLKKYRSKDEEIAVLAALLRHVYGCHGVRLTGLQRQALIRAVSSFDFRTRIPNRTVPQAEAHRILRECFDPDAKQWKVRERHVLDCIDGLVASAHRESLGRKIDLLIIDEAHKLEGTSRQRVITRLLRKRFDKCLFVTATPFALSVRQFKDRLLEFQHAGSCRREHLDAIRSLPLREFARAVERGDAYPGKKILEQQLQRYMVRDTWDHEADRETTIWRAPAQRDALVPTLVLERIIDAVVAQRGRTHIASRRESLCSSWAAAAESLRKNPLDQAGAWPSRLQRMVVNGRGEFLPDPKMRKVLQELVTLVSEGEKTVVFVQRVETARLLQRELRARLAEQTRRMSSQGDYWRRQAERLAALLSLSIRAAKLLAKIMGYSPDAPGRWNPRAIRRWWRKHQSRAFPAGETSLIDLEAVVGRGRHLPLVLRYGSPDGDADEDSHPRQKFNLPCAPLVLISTPKGQEGIDLHRYCRRVVLYDLTWNPAHMEQRIGRVHRLGGAYSVRRKIQVIYCYQEGTYEELMAKRVQARCKMLLVLLGAGQWLDEDEEIDDVEPYRMRFPP